MVAQREDLATNITRQLRLLGHARPFVLQAMVETVRRKDGEAVFIDGEPEMLRLFKSALCDSPEMAVRLVQELEGQRRKVIAFFTVINEITDEHAKALPLGEWVWTSDKRGTSTKERDIASRLALFVDFDPVRGIQITEHGNLHKIEVSATKQQQTEAIKAAFECYDYLAATMVELGIPPSCMLLANSGNGFHIVILLDRLPNTKEVSLTVRDILVSLATKYNKTDVLDVDTGVFDAKRLAPLYGTMKRKGVSTPETPHRRTFISDGATTRLTLKQLRALRTALAPQVLAPREGQAQYRVDRTTQYGQIQMVPILDVAARIQEQLGYIAALDAEHPLCPNPSCTKQGSSSSIRFLPEPCNYLDCRHRSSCGDGNHEFNGHYSGWFLVNHYCFAGVGTKPEIKDWFKARFNLEQYGHEAAIQEMMELEATMAEYERECAQHVYETVDGVPTIKVDRLASEKEVKPLEWGELKPLSSAEEPLPLFPTKVLPPAQRVYVQETSYIVQQPHDLAGCMSFGTMASALQRTHEIEVTDDWQEEISLFTTAVAKSGSNKSAIYKSATQAIERYEEESQQTYGRDKAAHKVRLKTLEQQLHAMERDKSADEELKIELQMQIDHMEENEPVKPQLLAADATQEALVGVLKEQRGSIGVMTSEGKQLYSLITGRYADKNDTKIELFLLGWGETYRGNRVKEDSKRTTIPNMRITVANMIQPEYVERMIANGELCGSGFMGRFLISYPKSTMGWRDTSIRSMRAGVQPAYDNTILTVLNGAPPKDGLHKFTMSEEAIRELEAYKASFEHFLRDGGKYEEMSSWMSKSCGFVVKLGAIMQAFENPSCPHAEPLSAELIKRAIVLVNYYREHFLRLVIRAHGHQAKSGAQKLIAWVKKTEAREFKAREVQQRIRDLKEKATLDFALEELEEKGWIRKVIKSHKPPMIVYEVSPKVFEPSSDRAPETLPAASTMDPIEVAAPVMQGTDLPEEPITNFDTGYWMELV
jgi:hypothetical protein